MTSIFHVHDMTPRQMRWSGVVLIVLGAILLGLGGFFYYVLTMIPADADVTIGQRITIAAIVGLALLCGATAIAQGVWMTVLGRRSWRLLRILQAIAAIFIAAGMIASLVMGDQPGARPSF